MVDTRLLLPRNVVQIAELPPLDTLEPDQGMGQRIYDGVMGVRPFARLAPYSEGGDDGRIYQRSDRRPDRPDRQRRAGGRPEQAGPVGGGADPAAYRAIYGVLFVSTEGGDIDDILRQERFTLFEVFLVAFAVMLLSSLYLAGTIAEPVRRLAAAADRVRSGPGRARRHSRLSRAQ